MFKPICCENISKSSIQKLTSKGFSYVSDLKICNNPWVTEICENITKETPKIAVMTAKDICQEDLRSDQIKTGCNALDDCLEGGLPCNRVIEVCSAPAQGKTQLCLQLCICVQLPKSVGGLGSEALYIDTAANFTAARLKDIAEYYGETFRNQSGSWNSEIALKNVHFIKVLGTAQFLAVMFILEKYIEEHPRIRLIVIDNIAMPFKDGCTDVDRIGILYRTLSLLNRLASQRKIAIIITNEVNLRLGLEQEQVGALGDTWAHLTHRLLLAPPLIAMRHRCGSAPIQIGRQGISDCAQ